MKVRLSEDQVKGSDAPKLLAAILGKEWDDVWRPACDKEFETLLKVRTVQPWRPPKISFGFVSCLGNLDLIRSSQRLCADSASMISLAEAFSVNHKRVKRFIVRINFMIEQ